MAVELFATAATRPDAIFCDACFLLDLLTHELASVGPLIENLDQDKKDRAEQVSRFFHTYASAGTQFFSTPYAFEELTHTLGKGVLRTHARPTPSGGKFTRWKDLEATEPATFVSLHTLWISVISDAWNQMQKNGIAFTVPEGGDSAYGSRVDSTVVELAQLLQFSYGSLDPADTYHIAMGLACGLEWFATVDLLWKNIAEINVFCDS